MLTSIPKTMWKTIKHLFSQQGKRGRKSRHTLRMLNGILFVLQGGIQWRLLPRQYGKKSTVHGAFVRWSRAGIFEQIHAIFTRLYIDKFCPTYLAIDAALSRARCGGSGLGKNPCDRGKKGIKKTIVTDDKGTTLLCYTSPANKHDIVSARALLVKIKSLLPENKIAIIAADSAYDAKDIKLWAKENNIAAFITQNNRRKKNIIPEERKLRSGDRWVIEAAHSWLNNYRSLLTRFTKHDFTFNQLLSFACAAKVFERLMA